MRRRPLRTDNPLWIFDRTPGRPVSSSSSFPEDVSRRPSASSADDRILDETIHTAASVHHLMHVFGISAKTVMTYVQAARPERRPTLPR